jgi:hypothetical protein
MFRKLLAALCCLAPVLWACTAAFDTTPAEQAVVRFHAMLDAGRFSEIYQQGATELTTAGSQEDFVRFLSTVHQRLGHVQVATKLSWRINSGTRGEFVNLGYKTAFDKGEAVESFTFRIDSGVGRLVGYHIQSDALSTQQLET